MREQCGERLRETGILIAEALLLTLGERNGFKRLNELARVFRRFIRERAERDVANDLAVPTEREIAAIGGLSDDGGVQAPLFEDTLRFRFAAGLQHHEHALLAFAQHEFVRRHALLARRNSIEIKQDARFALRRHFDR